MSWLSGVSIFLRARLIGWVLAALLLMLLIGGVSGYRLGGLRGDARVAVLVADSAQAKLDAVAAAVAERDRKQVLADRLAVELAQAQQVLSAVQIKLSRRVNDVTSVYLPPSPQPSPARGEGAEMRDAQAVALPRAVFTTGFVRLWDAANGIDLPASGATACRVGGEAGTGEAIGEACLYDSGTSQAEILTNHIDNALRCRAIEATLDKYIEWHRESPQP